MEPDRGYYKIEALRDIRDFPVTVERDGTTIRTTRIDISEGKIMTPSFYYITSGGLQYIVYEKFHDENKEMYLIAIDSRDTRFEITGSQLPPAGGRRRRTRQRSRQSRRTRQRRRR